jgi:hypothetical protein
MAHLTRVSVTQLDMQPKGHLNAFSLYFQSLRTYVRMGKSCMLFRARGLFRASLLVASAAALASAPGLGLVACGEEKGGLMLAVTTDMRAPKDVNVVTVAIQVGSEVKYNFTGRVTPEGEVLLPATLAIVEPADVGKPIKIRVIAFKDTEPKVLRDITTTAPTGGRLAMLRMPLSFVNEGSAKGQLPVTSLPPSLITKSFPLYPQTLKPLADAFNPWGAEVTTVCTNFEETMIDGECRPSYVDSSKLPEYSDALVWPNGDRNACFDSKTCLVGWREAAINLDTCTAPKGGDVKNVTLVTTGTGDCNENGKCFIPIDKEDDASATGWREVGDNIVLSKGVCKKLREASGGTKLGFTGNAACGSKAGGLPVCNGEKHPAADGGGVSIVQPDAGGDGGPINDLPAGVEKKFAADMASGIAVYADRIYYASKDGIYLVPEGQAPRLIPSSPTGPFTGPWFVSQFGDDVAFGLGTSIKASGDQRAFVLRASNTVRALGFNTPIGGTVRGAAISTPHAWFAVAGGTGSGDVYGDDGSSDAERALGSGPKNTTAIAYTSDDTLYVGLPDGHVDVCDGSSGSGIYCATNGATDSMQAVESIGVSNAAPDQAFVLTLDSVHFLKRTGPTSPPTVTRVVTADLGGIADVDYHPRGIAANAKCGFFASKTGVGYSSTTGQIKGDLVTLPARYPVVNVVVPVFGAGPPTHVYFVVRANSTTTGGVYRVAIPAACN